MDIKRVAAHIRDLKSKAPQIMADEKANEVRKSTRHKHFEMSYWGTKNACGTSCCSLGWAAHNPEFNKLGLKMEWKRSGRYSIKKGKRIPVLVGHVSFKDKMGFSAGVAFFDIGDERAEDWFSASADNIFNHIRRLEDDLTQYCEYNALRKPNTKVAGYEKARKAFLAELFE